MDIIIHQTHHSIADFDEIFDYLKQNFNSESTGMHLFPELFLCGYPLQDLCLNKSFVQNYESFLKNLKVWLGGNINSKECCLLMGGLKYTLSEKGIPARIENVIYQHGDKVSLTDIYTKRLLPNYDIFDEKKYFSEGLKPGHIQIFNKNVGLLICEDMWSSSFHSLDPVKELLAEIDKSNCPLDALINLSASPFITGKFDTRINRAKEIVNLFQCPFIYVNRVGAEDEILFDGQSFILNDNTILLKAKLFTPEIIRHALPKSLTKSSKNKQHKQSQSKSLTWEELFQARLELNKSPASLTTWSNDECSDVLNALAFGFQDYVKKNGFKKFSIALSGGMDSALVLTIIRLSLKTGQSLEAIYMPSIHSSPLSFELSLQLSKNLEVPMKSLPIKFLHSTAKNLFTQNFQEDFIGVTDENIQSRLRGLLIYTRSNQIGSMVVNTSNKSEIAVGYSTQYGDSVGAISMLGDLYKTQVYRLAKYINEHHNNIIPDEIISRPPTAELRPDQIDSESLPPYEILDAILEGILNYRFDKNDLIGLGFKVKDIEKVLNMYQKNEYKRYQFCPILKISSKSFGFGYRIPISKSSDFYQHK